jgi:hypothetical protein
MVVPLLPLPDRHHEIKVSLAWKVRNIRHPIGTVVTQFLQFVLILVRRHDHDVRTDVESIIWRVRFFRGIPHSCTDIHGEFPVNVRRAT